MEFDISFSEATENPINNWCCSGHVAPKTFKRNGADSEPEPIKFFNVVGKGINGVFCEPCLIIARYIANQNRKKKGK